MLSPIEVSEKLARLLEEDPNTLAVVLVGSYVRKKIYTADKHSDMEIYIVSKKDKKEVIEKSLPEIVSQFGEVIFSYNNQWAGFTTVYENLFCLELPIIKEADIGSVFSRPKAQPVKVLLDKTEGNLQKALDERPETIDFEKQFYDLSVDFWYMLLVSARYFVNGDTWSARHALETVVVTKVVRLMSYLTDPKLLQLERYKKVSKLLNKEHLKTLEKLSPNHTMEETKKAISETMNVYSDLAERIVQKNNFNYPQNIEDNLKPKIRRLLG